MDILAHTLWVGAGLALVRRRWPVKARTVALTIGLAALPDLIQLRPSRRGGWPAMERLQRCARTRSPCRAMSQTCRP